MAYVINKTNNQQLTSIPDGEIDISTSIRLVGKNYPGYGEVIAENLVGMLENFANNSAPSNPMNGQIWCDTSVSPPSMKYYSSASTDWRSFVIGESTEEISFGFGANTSIYNIGVAGFFRSASDSVAALGAISTRNVAFFASSAAATPAALFSNTNYLLSADGANVLTGVTLAGGAPQLAIFGQRREPLADSIASVSDPDAQTGAYGKVAYQEGSITIAGKFMTTITGAPGTASGAADKYGVVIGGERGLTILGGTSPFTGCHDGLLLKNTNIVPGDIVIDSTVVARSNMIDTITTVVVSTTPNQKGAIGIFDSVITTVPAILKETKMVQREESQGTVTVPEQVVNPQFASLLETHNIVSINSLGEGQMNVCGENGNIELGDLIVTSSIPGKGMKQADDIVRSITVAKARETVTFNSPTEVKLISCIYLCG